MLATMEQFDQDQPAEDWSKARYKPRMDEMQAKHGDPFMAMDDLGMMRRKKVEPPGPSNGCSATPADK